jgi:hypothetical protein
VFSGTVYDNARWSAASASTRGITTSSATCATNNRWRASRSCIRRPPLRVQGARPPDIACLSEQQCDQLRRFVRDGGSLVATHETSLYDEIDRTFCDVMVAGRWGQRDLVSNEGLAVFSRHVRTHRGSGANFQEIRRGSFEFTWSLFCDPAPFDVTDCLDR